MWVFHVKISCVSMCFLCSVRSFSVYALPCLFFFAPEHVYEEPIVVGSGPNKWYQSNGRTSWWNVQVNRLQLLSVEVEDAGHARVHRPMVASAIRRDQAKQD